MYDKLLTMDNNQVKHALKIEWNFSIQEALHDLNVEGY